MLPGYRTVLCLSCGAPFPTLARAPAWHCSYRCAEAAYRPWWPEKSA